MNVTFTYSSSKILLPATQTLNIKIKTTSEKNM